MEPISRAPDEELLNDGMALRHHLASCFRALRKRAAQRAETTVNLHAASSVMEDAMLRFYFGKWLTTAYFRSTLARPLHDFVCRQREPSKTAALLRQWSAITRADPRAILDDWPEGEDFDSIISVSGEYCLATQKTMADGRCKDVQVRLESGRRIQLASAVFRQLNGAPALLAEHRDALLLSAGAVPPPRMSAIQRLRQLREKSKSRARSAHSNSSSSASQHESEHTNSDDKSDYRSVDGSQPSDISDILDEGIQAASPSPVVIPSLPLHQSAAKELAASMKVISEGQRRADLARETILQSSVIDKAADQADQWAADDLRSAPPVGDADILAAANIAGVDSRLHGLLVHSTASAQHDATKKILARLASMEQELKEQKALGLRMAVAKPVSTDPYANLPGKERKFNIALDKVTHAIWEEHQLPSTYGLQACLDTTCSLLPPAGAKHCQCGAPTSILDLKCQHPACGMPCNGTVAEMLNQEICFQCRASLHYKLTPAQRAEVDREYAKISAATQGYDAKPPPDLEHIIPKKDRITEFENSVMMRHRRGSTKAVLAQGATSCYEALSAIKNQSEVFSQAELLGEDIDFLATMKIFVAAFKAISIGEGLLCILEDLVPVDGTGMYETFIQWTSDAMNSKTPLIDWDAPDSFNTLQKFFGFMDILISATGGDVFAADHHNACRCFVECKKAAGKNNANYTTRRIYLRYSYSLRWYHNLCIAWISKSPFFEKLYGQDLMWNNIGTDSQMPMYVVRFIRGGVGQFISVFDTKFERPAQLALESAAFSMAENASRDTGSLPDISGKLAGAQGEQESSGKTANPALSSKLITREEFRRNNLHASELAKSSVFKWPRVDGQWADTKLDMCLHCHGKGHSSSTCTVKKNDFAHININDVAILDINAFAKTVEKHPLNTAQWAGTYKVFRKVNFMEFKTRNEKREKAEQTHKQRKLPPADKKVEGKGGAAADAIKLQAIRQGEAIPRTDIKQLQLSDLKAKATVSAPYEPSDQLKADYFQYPVIEVRDLTVEFPGITPGTTLPCTAKMLDRDENLLTERGWENKRCLLVEIFELKKAKSAPTFAVLNKQANCFMANSASVRNKYNRFNHLTNVDKHINLSIVSHSDLASRNQALSPYFAKDGWIDEFGLGPIAIWTITGDVIELVVFILAADKERTAPLDSLISHISAYEGHAYELRWDQPIATLRDLLVLIPRMNRSVDIALDLCTQMADTLLGNPPVVPDYLSAQDTLSKLVRFLDGKPATRMVGKVKPMQTVQQQVEHLSTSEHTQKTATDSHSKPLDTAPAELQSTLFSSHPRTKQQTNSADHSTADYNAEIGVQHINELLVFTPAKLQSEVFITPRLDTKQQTNNTSSSGAGCNAENSVQQYELLVPIPAKLQGTSCPHTKQQNAKNSVEIQHKLLVFTPAKLQNEVFITPHLDTKQQTNNTSSSVAGCNAENSVQQYELLVPIPAKLQGTSCPHTKQQNAKNGVQLINGELLDITPVELPYNPPNPVSNTSQDSDRSNDASYDANFHSFWYPVTYTQTAAILIHMVMMAINPDHWILLWFTAALAALTVRFMHQYVPHTMHVPLSSHGSQKTHHSKPGREEEDDSDSDSSDSTAHDCDPKVSPQDVNGNHCLCADADGSNRCQRVTKIISTPPYLATECTHCTNQVPGLETVCSCHCRPCRVRSHRLSSVINVDLSHLNISILVHVERSTQYFTHFTVMHRWLIRCRLRALALLGMQRIYLMPDRSELDLSAIYFPPTSAIWNKNKRMDTDKSLSLMTQWAECELMHTHSIGVNTEASLLLAECDELAFTPLDSDEVLLWHRRRLVALVSVMGDHDDGTLSFNPDTNTFAEDPVLRVQAMTHAATAADRLLYAARVRRLPDIIINYAYGRDAVVSSSVLFQQQVFTSKYGTELFHNPHPLSPSVLNKLIIHNLLPDLLDHPGNCLCCSLPFKPVTCRKNKLGYKTVFCTRCGSENRLLRKAIGKSVVAIQRWWRSEGKLVSFAASSDEDSEEYQRVHGIYLKSWASGHRCVKDFIPLVPRKYGWPKISQDDAPAHSQSFIRTAIVSVDHWAAFCDKFALPFCPSAAQMHSQAHKLSVARQVAKFIAYETVTFNMNVHSVVQGLAGVSAYCRAIGYPDPFSPNIPVTTAIQEALEAEALEFTNLDWGAVNTSFAGNFWIVRTTEISFRFWRFYCKELQKRELELAALLTTDNFTIALPQNVTTTQPALPTSSKLGMKVAELQHEELRRSLRCFCTSDTAGAFHRLPYSEATLQQQDLDYTCVHSPVFTSEEHRRPCNALQDLSITYFELPDVLSTESGPTLPTSGKLGAKTKHVMHTNTASNQRGDQAADTPITHEECVGEPAHRTMQHTSAESALELAIPYLEQHIPYTPTVYESRSCQGDHTDPQARLFDSITEAAYECIDDQAVRNISDHLHRMAAIDDYYSDSGENEVEKAVDELSEVASAVVIRHAFMAMGTWLSILLLTSRHLAWAIRELFAYAVWGSAKWVLNKVHKIWHKPVISYLCPSMTHNSPQYKKATRSFYLTSDPQYKEASYLSVRRIIHWIDRGVHDSAGCNAWITLAQKVKYRHHINDIFLVYRHLKLSVEHSPKALVTRAISSFKQSTNSFTYQNLQAKLVSQALFTQSAEFALECQGTVAAAKQHANLCGAQGCWCKVQSSQTGYPIQACRLEHAFEVLSAIIDDLTESQVSQCIENLRSFDEYDSFSTNLAMNRYNKDGLLAAFSGSSFRRADTCYLCTELVVGKATTKHKITFCDSCWVINRPKARLSILFHTERQRQLSQSDTSSNSSFEELGSPMSSVTNDRYEPRGDFHSDCLSPPSFAQIDANTNVLQQFQNAVDRKRYALEGDNWLTRIRTKFTSNITAAKGRYRKLVQRWCPEYSENASMDTVMSPSPSEEWPDELPMSTWLRKRHQRIDTRRPVIPVNTLPQYLKCSPSTYLNQLNSSRTNQQNIDQYFRPGLAVNQPQNKTH